MMVEMVESMHREDYAGCVWVCVCVMVEMGESTVCVCVCVCVQDCAGFSCLCMHDGGEPDGSVFCMSASPPPPERCGRWGFQMPPARDS